MDHANHKGKSGKMPKGMPPKKHPKKHPKKMPKKGMM